MRQSTTLCVNVPKLARRSPREDMTGLKDVAIVKSVEQKEFQWQKKWCEHQPSVFIENEI